MHSDALQSGACKLAMKKPEILAPAGTWSALEAAVKAGADAIYLGGSLFSARAFAGNFDTETLIRAIEYSHFFDVRIYLALNTLLKPDEISSVPDYVRSFYKAGLDGVIVQDMGVLNVLKAEFPDLPLHASTQMSISSHYGAELMKSLGVTRIVPSRELSLEEIKRIKSAVDVELETFVHGAMCYAYSGRCLMSSFLGGRSGNRGRCAQPCRQTYKLTCPGRPLNASDNLPETAAASNLTTVYVKSGTGKNPKQRAGGNICNNCDEQSGKYIMSLKDMCTLESIPRLMDAGIDSFKIEGRMKKPEYVAATVDAYRKAADMYSDGEWDEREILHLKECMMDIYNRGGFSSGYYFMQNGPEMLTPDRPNHTGLKVGTVSRVAPPKVYVSLEKDVSPGDVFEIRYTNEYDSTAYHREKNVADRKNGKNTADRGNGKNTAVRRDGKNAAVRREERNAAKPADDRKTDSIRHSTKDDMHIERCVELTGTQSASGGETLVLNGRKFDLIRTGMDVCRVRNNKLIESLQKDMIDTEKQAEANACVRAKTGEPLTIIIEDDRASVCVTGSRVESAANRPTDADTVKVKMQKTGGTGLKLNVSCDIDPDAFIPMSELNELRHEAMEKFKRKLVSRFYR